MFKDCIREENTVHPPQLLSERRQIDKSGGQMTPFVSPKLGLQTEHFREKHILQNLLTLKISADESAPLKKRNCQI
jgi:hypothetical protein